MCPEGEWFHNPERMRDLRAFAEELRDDDELLLSKQAFGVLGFAWLRLGEEAVRSDDEALALDNFVEAKSALFEALGMAGEAAVLVLAGLAMQSFGKPAESLQLYEGATGMFKDLGDAKGAADALTRMGHIHRHLAAKPEDLRWSHQPRGASPEALRCFEQALPLFGRVGDEKAYAQALLNVGREYPNLARAIHYLNRALVAFEGLRDSRGCAETHMELGHALRVSGVDGELVGSLDEYEQALGLFQEVGDLDGCAEAMYFIGRVHDDVVRDPFEALRYYEMALLVMEELESSPREGDTLCRIGSLFQRTEELEFTDSSKPHHEVALEFYERSILKFREDGLLSGEVRALKSIAEIYRTNMDDPYEATWYFLRSAAIGGTGNCFRSVSIAIEKYIFLDDLEERRRCHELALSVFRSMGKLELFAKALRFVFDCWADEAPNQSMDLLEMEMAVHQETGDRAETASCLLATGRLYEEVLDDPVEAMKLYEIALPQLEHWGKRVEYGLALLRAGGLDQDHFNEPVEAARRLDTAVEVFEEIDCYNGQAEALSRLGALHWEVFGDPEGASRYLVKSLELPDI